MPVRDRRQNTDVTANNNCGLRCAAGKEMEVSVPKLSLCSISCVCLNGTSIAAADTSYARNSRKYRGVQEPRMVIEE